MIGFYLLKNKDKNLYVMRGIGYFRSRFTEPADRLRQPPKRSELLGGCTDPAADLVKSRSFKAWSKREMSAKDRVIRKSWPVWAGSATRSFVLASLVALLPSLSLTQATSIQIPSTTPLVVQLFQHVPMKTGESLEGRLLYPVYVENQIAIPAGTVFRGSVIQLDSDRSRRIHSRLRGDFTPFHVPVVRFDQLLLPDGTLQAIVSDSSKDGVPILRLSPPPGKRKGPFISRQIAARETAAERCRRASHRTRSRRPARSIHLHAVALSPGKDRKRNFMDGCIGSAPQSQVHSAERG